MELAERFNTFDKRCERAALDYPDEKNISERVRKLERSIGLKPFTPKEILAQRNGKEIIKIKSEPMTRPCPRCGNKMVAKGVCTSCPQFQQGANTHWTCVGCGAEDYNERTADEWRKILSQ